MKRFVLALVAGIFLVLGGVAFAAPDHTITITVTAFGVVNLNPDNDFTLTIDGTGITAGDGAGINRTNNTNWVQYTFITNIGASTVNVQMDNPEALPAWLTLSVTAANPAGAGAGTRGTGGTRALTPGMAAASLITGIGSCYTGTAMGVDGCQLTYTASVANITLASADTFGPYTVLYTVTP